MELDKNYARLRDQADAAVNSGSADAPKLTADAVRWCRDHLSPDHPELAWALIRQAHDASGTSGTGLMVEVCGRIVYAFVPLFEEALAILRRAFGPYSEPVATVLLSFANCLSSRDQLAAIAPLRDRLTVLQRLRGPSHPDVGVAACVLAQALSQSAQTLTEEARAQPPSVWSALAWSGRGFLAENTGDLDTADHTYRQAVQVTRAMTKEPSLDLAMHLLAAARIAVRRGKQDAAVPLFEEALAIQRTILQDASLDMAATWSSISLATGGTRSLEASREALRTAGAWLETGAAAELAMSGAPTSWRVWPDTPTRICCNCSGPVPAG